VGDAIADPLTGLTAAALAMSTPAGGAGMLWDVSMTDVVAATLEPAEGPAPQVRRDGARWTVETATGPAAIADPRPRRPRGVVADPGRDSEAVLAELGISRCTIRSRPFPPRGLPLAPAAVRADLCPRGVRSDDGPSVPRCRTTVRASRCRGLGWSRDSRRRRSAGGFRRGDRRPRRTPAPRPARPPPAPARPRRPCRFGVLRPAARPHGR